MNKQEKNKISLRLASRKGDACSRVSPERRRRSHLHILWHGDESPASTSGSAPGRATPKGHLPRHPSRRGHRGVGVGGSVSANPKNKRLSDPGGDAVP